MNIFSSGNSMIMRQIGIQSKMLYNKDTHKFSKLMQQFGQNSIIKEQQKVKYHQEIMGTADSIAKRRRQQHKYLELTKKEKQEMQMFVEAYTDTVIEFQLFFYHYHPKCQELDAILNYYQIAYKRQNNDAHIDFLINQNPQLKEQINDGILKVNVSLDPVKYVTGQEIIRFLIENDFIVIPKHQTNSVFAKQGVEFAKKVSDNLDTMFLHPSLTFENLLKTNPESYKQGKSRILVKVMFKYTWQIAKQCVLNVRKIQQNPEEYKSARDVFVQQMDEEWAGRLGENDYHGGESPDEADFAMFGVLKAKHNSRSFQNFVDNKLSAPVRRWFLRMRQNCRYEKDRILYNQ